MEEKKKKNTFLKIIFAVFILFLLLYLMDDLGYYNIRAKNKVLTEEKIKEFESDVKNGKSIDLKEYTVDNTNYRNVYSNIGYNLSNCIDTVLNKGFKEFGKILKKLFK